MTVTPRGFISCPLEKIADMIRACVVWDVWVAGYGSYGYGYGTGAEEVLDYYDVLGIGSSHVYTVEGDFEDARPAVTLFVGPNHKIEKMAEQSFWQTSSVIMIIEDNVSTSDEVETERDKEIWFNNIVSDLITNMKQLSGRDGYPDILQMNKLSGTSKSAKVQGEIQEYFEIVYEIIFQGI